MSASNWDICPACRRRAIIAKDTAIREANAAYGKVSPDEYMKMVTEANKEVKLEPSLREDWELGITEKGDFYVIYHGHCQTCSFGFDYKYDKKLTEIDRDRICCECHEDYSCDLLDPNDDPVWCPKCRETQAPKKNTKPANAGPKLEHP